jgi:SAM-dependent methyltransferase
MTTDHWQQVWTTKRADEVSWHQPAAGACADVVRRLSDPGDRVAVIGAGVSALAVELARTGDRRVVAVDISAAALDALRATLGPDAGAVEYVVADVRALRLAEPVDVWHDRATLHFLTDESDQAAYAARARAAVRAGGHLVSAQFAPGGPEQCSGLPVARHDAASLARLLTGFRLVESFETDHTTPWGATQRFLHTVLRRDDHDQSAALGIDRSPREEHVGDRSSGAPRRAIRGRSRSRGWQI